MVGWYHQLYGHEFEQAQLVIDRRPESINLAVHGVPKIERCDLSNEKQQMV